MAKGWKTNAASVKTVPSARALPGVFLLLLHDELIFDDFMINLCSFWLCPLMIFLLIVGRLREADDPQNTSFALPDPGS